MKKLFFLFLCLAGVSAWAQNKPGILIILNNGDSLHSNYVGINNVNTIFRGPHIRLHPEDKKQRISISEVNSIEGFDSSTQKYRYFKRLNTGYNVLAERAFKSDRIATYYFDSYHAGIYGGGYSWRHLHYSKNGAPLAKASYANLKRDLSDNPIALTHLKKANQLRITQYVMYGIGTGLLVASFQRFLSDAKKNVPGAPMDEDMGPDQVVVLGVAGAIMLRIPFFLNNPKQRELNKALEAY